MTALELRLIAYGLLAFLMLGGSGFGGYQLASHHYERLMAADQLAQQNAVIAAQEKTAAVVAAQQAASIAAEKQYEDLRTSANTLGDQLANSLRQYASLRDAIVSTAGSSAASAHAASKGPSGDQSLTGLAGQAATGCLEDAAELTALQSWALRISQSTPSK